MYKNPDTGFYEHDFRVKGVPRYHLSYGVAKKGDAERLHAAAVALFKSGELAVINAMRAGKVTIEQLAQLRDRGRPFAAAIEEVALVEPWPMLPAAIEEYLQAIRDNVNRSQGTANAAFYELRRFTAYITARFATPDVRVDAIGAQTLDDYQSALYAEGLKQNTVSAYVSRVGSLYHWLIHREARNARDERRAPRVLHVPLDPETISREKTARVRYLSEPEAQVLLAATPRPLLFPVAAGLLGGFRIDEVCHFRPAHDVDRELWLLSVQKQPTWQPKTKRSLRHVPVAERLRAILEYHLAHYASDDWVMPALRNPARPVDREVLGRQFGRIVDDAGLISGREDPEGVTFHTLRHTFASWSLMAGTDVFTVAKLLGNTVQQVENTYGKLSRDFRQQAVDRLGKAVAFPVFDEEDATDQSENSATENATMEGVST